MANKRTAKRAINGEQLTKATAEKVFGWKNVHKHNGELTGKKQDRAGRWRKAKVPDFSPAKNGDRSVVKNKLLLDSVDAWLLTQKSIVNPRKRSLYAVVMQRRQPEYLQRSA